MLIRIRVRALHACLFLLTVCVLLASDGQFEPYRNEGHDGYDSIEWAAAQPWANGDVGTFGLSYPGAVQWRAAEPAGYPLINCFTEPGDNSDRVCRSWHQRSTLRRVVVDRARLPIQPYRAESQAG